MALYFGNVSGYWRSSLLPHQAPPRLKVDVGWADIAGGLGNFIDRIRQGFVVDMFQLDFINFAIFNVADMYLTFGVAILLLMILKEEKDGSKN
jgi:endonuclease V-like protein UPF0215 family